MIQGSSYPYLPTKLFFKVGCKITYLECRLQRQTRQMMNQRITNTSTNVQGAIVPLTIQGLVGPI
jgi:hypothetical protein